MNIKIKRDKYRSARGGNTKIMDIICNECGNLVLIYQKDGIGSLVRCYIDRIIWPENIASTHHLICSNCKTLIGNYMIYERENRPAYRMQHGKFRKKQHN